MKRAKAFAVFFVVITALFSVQRTEAIFLPEFAIDEPITDAINANNQMAPSVAFNGSIYVVAWHHEINATNYVVRLKRFNAAGEPFGSVQTITNAAYAQIASNGREFVILWRYDGIQTMTARLDAGGSLIPGSLLATTLGDFPVIASNGSDYILFSSWPNPAYRRLTALGFGPLVSIPSPNVATGAAIASDGTNYLAVWCLEQPDARHILGARIGADGLLIDSEPFEIAPKVAFNPSIAFNNGLYLVTWQSPGIFLYDIYAKRIRPDRAILDATPIPLSPGGGGENGAAVVGAFDDGFRAIWLHFHNLQHSVEFDTILAADISTNGVVSPSILFSEMASSAVQQFAITARGPNAFGIWTTYSDETAYDVFARFMPHAGPLGETQVLERGPNVETAPSVAFGSNDYLVVWQDNRNSFTNRNDIFARYVDAFGRPKGSAAFSVRADADDQTSPVVAAAGDRYLVVWRQLHEDGDNGFTADVRGAILAGQTVLKEFTFTSLPFDERAPAVASNGRDFLVTWRDGRAGVDDIYGMHVTREGVLSGPENGFPICANDFEQAAPAVASNGANYLVVWRDTRNDLEGLTDDDIYGAIVETGSTNLPTEFPISVIGTDQRAPDVASNGRDYFVTWRDDRNKRSAPTTWVGIYGAPVSPTGVVGDVTGFPLAPPGVHQREPSIARLGDDYILAWLEDNATNEHFYNIYARRIFSDGSNNSPVVKVSETYFDAETLALASESPLYAMVVSQTTDRIARIKGAPVCFDSCPTLVTATATAGGRTLTWNAVPNHVYRIEFKTDLNDGAWQLLKEITAADDGFIQFADPAPDAMRFYRIVHAL